MPAKWSVAKVVLEMPCVVRSKLLLLLSCASHMLSASRRQPHLLHVSAVDRRQTWSMDKSWRCVTLSGFLHSHIVRCIIWYWPKGSDAPLLVKSNVVILLCLRLVGWPQNGTSSQMVRKKNRIYSVTVYCFCFWVCDWSVLQLCALLCGIAGLCVKTTVYCSRTTSCRLGSSQSLGRTSAGWIYSTATKHYTSFIRLFLMSTVPARCQLISFQ